VGLNGMALPAWASGVYSSTTPGMRSKPKKARKEPENPMTQISLGLTGLKAAAVTASSPQVR
jgi:hypothetical protein